MLFRSGPTSFKSVRQDSVATSTAHAEIEALFQAAREVVYIQNILSDLGLPQTNTIIYEDNRPALSLCQQDMSAGHARSKHFDIKWKWITEQITKEKIKPLYCPSALNPADIFTKNLLRILFRRLIDSVLAPPYNLTPLDEPDQFPPEDSP